MSNDYSVFLQVTGDLKKEVDEAIARRYARGDNPTKQKVVEELIKKGAKAEKYGRQKVSSRSRKKG